MLKASSCAAPPAPGPSSPTSGAVPLRAVVPEPQAHEQAVAVGRVVGEDPLLLALDDRLVDRLQIDAHDGDVAVDGWTKGSGMKVLDFAKMMESIGAKTVVFTDIARDGMLTGPATAATRTLCENTKLSVIASGGIGSEENIDEIKTSGCTGVIVGKAIYEGKVRLDVCLAKE